MKIISTAFDIDNLTNDIYLMHSKLRIAQIAPLYAAGTIIQESFHIQAEAFGDLLCCADRINGPHLNFYYVYTFNYRKAVLIMMVWGYTPLMIRFLPCG